MSFSDGNYHIFSDVGHFRLAWYQGNTVKVNDSSNVLVEIKKVTGGYQMRYNNHGTKSPWFGASDNLKREDRVLISGDSDFVWAITPAGGGLFKIQIYNEDVIWYLRDGISNGGSVQLGRAKGGSSELWNIQPAN